MGQYDGWSCTMTVANVTEDTYDTTQDRTLHRAFRVRCYWSSDAWNYSGLGSIKGYVSDDNGSTWICVFDGSVTCARGDTKKLGEKVFKYTRSKDGDVTKKFKAKIVSGSTYAGKYTRSADAVPKTITQRPSYAIKYYGNGGSGDTPDEIKWYAADYTIKNYTLTKTGYTRQGTWYTNNNGTGTPYAKGAKYTTEAALNLYAYFTPNKYTVTLNPNGGTGGTTSISATFNDNMPLLATAPSRTGYTFAGYYSSTSGGTQYYTNTKASARTWNVASASTLYAHWTPITKTVTFNSNDDRPSPNLGTLIKTYDSAMTITIANPTRSGYTFKGWSSSNSATTASYTTSFNTNITTNITLYAVWTPAYVKPEIILNSAARYKTDSTTEPELDGDGEYLGFTWSHKNDTYQLLTIENIVAQVTASKGAEINIYEQTIWSAGNTSVERDHESSLIYFSGTKQGDTSVTIDKFTTNYKLTIMLKLTFYANDEVDNHQTVFSNSIILKPKICLLDIYAVSENEFGIGVGGEVHDTGYVNIYDFKIRIFNRHSSPVLTSYLPAEGDLTFTSWYKGEQVKQGDDWFDFHAGLHIYNRNTLISRDYSITYPKQNGEYIVSEAYGDNAADTGYCVRTYTTDQNGTETLKYQMLFGVGQSNTNRGVFDFGGDDFDGAGNWLLWISNTNAVGLGVDSSNLYLHGKTHYLNNGSGNWVELSDARYKNSTILSSKYENFFFNLQPVSFIYKDGGKRSHLGFISQDVKQALLQADLTTNDFAGYVYQEEEDLHSLRYTEFIALNTYMLQKSFQRIEQLEQQVKQLTAAQHLTT